MSRLSVHLLTYNGEKYIPFLFESLRDQTFKDWELLILDNASTDRTVETVKKELKNFSQPWQLIENKNNIGFAAGHNQLLTTNYQLLTTNYVLLLNQDTILSPGYLEKLISFMDANPKAAAAQGAILKWSFDKKENGKSDIIDSLGLKVFRNRRVVDWMAGEKFESVIASEAKQSHLTKGSPRSAFSGARDDKQETEIFGVSGTLPVYRCQALEDVAINGEIFDEDFFSYKEDVDLAYRLRSTGWKAYLAPEARAWHERSAAGSSNLGDKSAIINRRSKSAFINYHSYKNHLLVLLKNEYSANFLRDWPWIIWYEFRKFVYLLFFEPQNLIAWKEIFKLWPKMRAKRKIIKLKRKLSASEFRACFK